MPFQTWGNAACIEVCPSWNGERLCTWTAAPEEKSTVARTPDLTYIQSSEVLHGTFVSLAPYRSGGIARYRDVQSCTLLNTAGWTASPRVTPGATMFRSRLYPRQKWSTETVCIWNKASWEVVAIDPKNVVKKWTVHIYNNVTVIPGTSAPGGHVC